MHGLVMGNFIKQMNFQDTTAQKEFLVCGNLRSREMLLICRKNISAYN